MGAEVVAGKASLIEFLPSLQHSLNQPEDVFKVDADDRTRQKTEGSAQPRRVNTQSPTWEASRRRATIRPSQQDLIFSGAGMVRITIGSKGGGEGISGMWRRIDKLATKCPTKYGEEDRTQSLTRNH